MSRPATPVVYPNDEVFTIGKAKVVRKSDSDQVLVVAAGVTLHEAIKAADTLAEKVKQLELHSGRHSERNVVTILNNLVQ